MRAAALLVLIAGLGYRRTKILGCCVISAFPYRDFSKSALHRWVEEIASQSLNKMRNLIKLRVTIQVRVSWACGHFPLKKRTKSSTLEVFRRNLEVLSTSSPVFSHLNSYIRFMLSNFYS